MLRTLALIIGLSTLGPALAKGTKRFGIAHEPSFEAWPQICATWLKSLGFLDKR